MLLAGFCHIDHGSASQFLHSGQTNINIVPANLCVGCYCLLYINFTSWFLLDRGY